jgi:hypothetical protein
VRALTPNSCIFSVGLSSTLHEEIGILFNVAVCITVELDFIAYGGTGNLTFLFRFILPDT